MDLLNYKELSFLVLRHIYPFDYSDMTKIDTEPECIGKHIVLLFLHAECFVVQSFNSVAHL